MAIILPFVCIAAKPLLLTLRTSPPPTTTTWKPSRPPATIPAAVCFGLRPMVLLKLDLYVVLLLMYIVNMEKVKQAELLLIDLHTVLTVPATLFLLCPFQGHEFFRIRAQWFILRVLPLLMAIIL